MILYSLILDLCYLSALRHMRVECFGFKPIISNGTSDLQSGAHHSKIIQTHSCIIENI